MWIELLLMVTDPFLIGGMFGSPASGKMMVVLVFCMMILRLMFPLPRTVAWCWGETSIVMKIGHWTWPEP